MLTLNSNRKRIIIALLAVLIVSISALLILPTCLKGGNTLNSVSEREKDFDFNTKLDVVNGMETLSYNIDIIVSEKNVYSITESIIVDLSANYNKHGIIRTIPYEGIIYRTDSQGHKTETFEKAIIKNIKVEGYDYSVSNNKDGKNREKVIKIGDANKTVSGIKTYNIKYDFVRPNDTFEGFDEFYYNLLPVNWETRIQYVSFKITFPKKAILNNAVFYTGANEKILHNLNIDANANSISADNINDIEYKNGLSARIELPDGYFQMNFDRYIVVGIILGVVTIILAIAALLRFTIFKQDKVVPIITFNPPKNLTSADIGYIIDGIADNKDIISLLIYWANKDIITIVESSSEEVEFIKMSDLPQNAELYETTIFNKLFEYGDKVQLSSLEYNFASTLKSAKHQLVKSFSSPQKRLYTTASVYYRYIMVTLCAICLIGFFGYFGYTNNLFSNLILVIVSLCCGILNAIGIFCFLDGIKLVKHNKTVGKSYIVGGLFILILLNFVVGMYMLSYLMASDIFMFYIATELIIIAALCFVINSLFSTKYCLEMRGEIYGLKDFIEKTEKDKIEKLVQEDPKYFYSVLPFAYAMDITDAWCEKFESIALEPPNWYVGGNMSTFNTIIFMSIINNQMHSINTTMTSTKSRGSGGHSSFGGGGSFGGGFSGGGGFGGGGGGSW